MTTATGMLQRCSIVTPGVARFLELRLLQLDMQACLYLCDLLGLMVWTNTSVISLSSLQYMVWHKLISDDRLSNQRRFELIIEAEAFAAISREIFSCCDGRCVI